MLGFIYIPLILVTSIVLSGCGRSLKRNHSLSGKEPADEVKQETSRSWQAYKKYVWWHDGLNPPSKRMKTGTGNPSQLLSSMDKEDYMPSFFIA